jgi:diguanylate cyclase
MDRGPRRASGVLAARRPGMLWNKRKSAEMPSVDATSPERSGYREADADRGLDGLRNLLECYGRFAFDTDESSAIEIRGQCETWAQRIALGEPRRRNAGDVEGDGPARRDWPGLNRFFEDQRKHESHYVTRSLGALRQAVLAFARSLSGASGEDQTSDARVEKHLAALSHALEQNDARRIAKEATSVIETARESMAQRRKREARQIVELGSQLRQVREELAVAGDSASADEVTGLHNRAGFEQQLEQLAAMGLLLAERPWLLVLEVDQLAGVCQRYGQPLADDILRQVSHVLTRTFLRKQDFVARYTSERLAVLLVDITQDQVIGAVDRVLAGVHKVAIRPTLSRALSITASIGLTPLRANDTPSTWSSRAHLALERAQEDGRDRYELSR